MVVTLDSEARATDSPEAPSTEPDSAAQDSKPATKRRKSTHGWSMRLLRKVWLPLVIIIVIVIAAFSVYRLHGVFGKTETTREGSGLANDTKPFNPKTVVYEIYGPPGTVATINYLDLDATPQIARDVTLPWSLTLTTTAPAASANIVAQGDSDTIGCRIFVNGELKDEKTSNGVNAQTFCLVKSA
jgi:flagellar basal body-associated protein FliL